MIVGRPPGDGAICHLSAASGLVRIGERLYVVADDETDLGLFDLRDAGPGRLFRLFDEDLPLEHAARKAAKPDLEALALLPSSAGDPRASLLAFGSGSKRNRDRAVLVQLDEQGDPVTDPRHVDLSPLYSALRREFADLNIEGAFVAGGELCLLQRGNLRSPVNACVRYEWHAFERWLRDDGPVPTLRSIVRWDLGQIEGVPLCFTDGAALPGGGWVFCAAAEATADSYTDGRCVGSAVGVVSASGALIAVQPLGLVCKTEGITATVDGDRLEILLVTDTDDRSVPAQLLSGSLPAH